MYLKNLKINHFRKFNKGSNIIEFVSPNKPKKNEKINIASSTTLIVGKNNSGKTTITTALEKLSNNSKFKANDFNFSYLKRLLKLYKKDKFKCFPLLKFEMLLSISDNSYINNFIPFIKIEDSNKNHFKIILKYEIKESDEFKDKIKLIIKENKNIFQNFLKLIDKTDFELNYFNSDNKKIKNSKLNIKNLIEIKTITANKTIDGKNLSKTFNKIIEYKYKKLNNTESIKNKIDEINKDITKHIKESHTSNINKVLGKIEKSNILQVNLSADLTFDKLMKNLIRYEYIEDKLNIPEGQFGLGYANLMTIIGELIEYIEKYSKDDFDSKINLICIEEPEAFMHPQMQELFIKNINDALDVLLNDSKKIIKSQLIITTHSSHILNSKIHTGNSFNNINYVTTVKSEPKIINLSDKRIMNNKQPKKEESEQDFEKRKKDNLKFIKKHIKFKVSELFFSDIAIFVEGITEEVLLSYYIDKDDKFNKYYVSIFNINGSHGLVYEPLIKLLQIPTLMITDLDIKRDDNEKKDFSQIDKLKDRETTNQTINEYNENDKDISDIKEKNFKDDNLYIAFQSKPINGYFATSFEEAFILHNYDNSILQTSLEKTKPKIYKNIIGKDKKFENLKESSYKLQKKLSDSKSNFANNILYELFINETEDIPKLPDYISNGLNKIIKMIEE